MNKTELKETFINCLERERVSRGWTQQEMADKLEMSLPGYRKMVQGLTESIALCNAYNAAKIFTLPISALIESQDERELVCRKLYELPMAVSHRLNFYLDTQKKLQECSRAETEYPVDVIHFSGYLQDGVVFDSYSVETRMFDFYLKEPCYRALYISENTFLPTYAKGDILFLNESNPRNGDVAVIMDSRTRKLFIRKLVIKEHYEFHSVSGMGRPLIITQEDRPNWMSFGQVIGHYHLD